MSCSATLCQVLNRSSKGQTNMHEGTRSTCATGTQKVDHVTTSTRVLVAPQISGSLCIFLGSISLIPANRMSYGRGNEDGDGLLISEPRSLGDSPRWCKTTCHSTIYRQEMLLQRTIPYGVMDRLHTTLQLQVWASVLETRSVRGGSARIEHQQQTTHQGSDIVTPMVLQIGFDPYAALRSMLRATSKSPNGARLACPSQSTRDA